MLYQYNTWLKSHCFFKLQLSLCPNLLLCLLTSDKHHEGLANIRSAISPLNLKSFLNSAIHHFLCSETCLTKTSVHVCVCVWCQRRLKSWDGDEGAQMTVAAAVGFFFFFFLTMSGRIFKYPPFATLKYKNNFSYIYMVWSSHVTADLCCYCNCNILRLSPPSPQRLIVSSV